MCNLLLSNTNKDTSHILNFLQLKNDLIFINNDSCDKTLNDHIRESFHKSNMCINKCKLYSSDIHLLDTDTRQNFLNKYEMYCESYITACCYYRYTDYMTENVWLYITL
jgi:hypothetical protein